MPDRYSAILLDVDGTLVDSNDLHAQAWRDTLLDHGYDVPYARIRSLVGMGGDKLVPAATGLKEGSAEAGRIVEERGKLFLAKYAAKVRAFPHVRDLLARLKDEGYQLVVATSAKREELEAILTAASLRELLAGKTTTADDADESKPDPDIVKAALKKAQVLPAQAVMLGDTPYDVAAAHGAGVAIIGFRSGGFKDADLKGAEAIYDGPADLLEHFATSPLGRQRR